MGLRFTNTLTRRKEEFKPIEDGHVKMYTCGPTVYDYAHIGNFRAYTFEDVLRRYLKYKGYEVTQVMNLTDIDDKTIKGCQEESISLDDYTARYKKAFFEDLDSLRIERAELYPEATKHIDEMVEMVRVLLDKGYAYEAGGSVYYKISKFPEYGKLSHMDISQLKAGARVASDEYEKEEVSDFALWKGWDEADGPVFWKTELGKGRPGWHIEWSAMSMKYLGNHFDIHCGGVDNIFPHHENEI
ncbi:MAG: class I tRNA ligase family protein, partial [candidate division Zixibacteria bacterium]|nr:class I tRNA ligase family protein [candidate division Zixibacteria bacterium]